MGCIIRWQESSVEKFGAVHAKLEEGGKETTRGASLRDLQRFFEEHDKDKGYAGLRRIGNDDGTALWTLIKEEEVTAKLAERAKERQQEEQRRDMLLIAALKINTPSETKEVKTRPRPDIDPQPAVVVLDELQQIKVQVGQVREDLAAMKNGPAVTVNACKCSVL